LDLEHCDRCNACLSRPFNELALAPGALAFQLAGDQALHGRQRDAAMACEASEWFYRARFVSGILRVGATNGSKTFAAFRKAFNLGKIARPVSGLPIEMLPVAERMNLFTVIWTIMEAGETQLIDAVRACGLSRRSIVVPAGEATPRLQAMLDDLRPGKAREHAPTAIRTPVPKSRVEKMWARLKRKAQRDG